MRVGIALKSGDFNRDSLGGPYDVVLMSDILHYQNLATNAALVKKNSCPPESRWTLGHQGSVSRRIRHESGVDGGLCGAHSGEHRTGGLLPHG